jgi:hypothetical protein
VVQRVYVVLNVDERNSPRSCTFTPLLNHVRDPRVLDPWIAQSMQALARNRTPLVSNTSDRRHRHHSIRMTRFVQARPVLNTL